MVLGREGACLHYRPWRDSCRGPRVVITAPATDVWRASAKREGFWSPKNVFSTGQGCGTSFAVATVAGITACWLNHWGGWDHLLQKLGNVPRRIPASYLECLRRHQATPVVIPSESELPPSLKGYPDFNPADFGHGVIHVENLLKISPFDLPQPEEGATASVSAPAAAGDTLSALAGAMPGVSKHTLRRALAAELQLGEEEPAGAPPRSSCQSRTSQLQV